MQLYIFSTSSLILCRVSSPKLIVLCGSHLLAFLMVFLNHICFIFQSYWISGIFFNVSPHQSTIFGKCQDNRNIYNSDNKLILELENAIVFESLRCVPDTFVMSWTVAHQAPLSMGFPKQEYWSGLPLPSPITAQGIGIFLTTQGLNLHLLHWQTDSLLLSHQGRPRIIE